MNEHKKILNPAHFDFQTNALPLELRAHGLVCVLSAYQCRMKRFSMTCGIHAHLHTYLHTRVTIPANGLDPTPNLQITSGVFDWGNHFVREPWMRNLSHVAKYVSVEGKGDDRVCLPGASGCRLISPSPSPISLSRRVLGTENSENNGIVVLENDT